MYSAPGQVGMQRGRLSRCNAGIQYADGIVLKQHFMIVGRSDERIEVGRPGFVVLQSFLRGEAWASLSRAPINSTIPR